MPLFRCANCQCVDNTALADFWIQRHFEKVPPQCSECRTGTWHGRFPKRPAAGFHIDNSGFLWSDDQVEAGQLPAATRIVGRV